MSLLLSVSVPFSSIFLSLSVALRFCFSFLSSSSPSSFLPSSFPSSLTSPSLYLCNSNSLCNLSSFPHSPSALPLFIDYPPFILFSFHPRFASLSLCSALFFPLFPFSSFFHPLFVLLSRYPLIFLLLPPIIHPPPSYSLTCFPTLSIFSGPLLPLSSSSLSYLESFLLFPPLFFSILFFMISSLHHSPHHSPGKLSFSCLSSLCTFWSRFLESYCSSSMSWCLYCLIFILQDLVNWVS